MYDPFNVKQKAETIIAVTKEIDAKLTLLEALIYFEKIDSILRKLKQGNHHELAADLRERLEEIKARVNRVL